MCPRLRVFEFFVVFAILSLSSAATTGSVNGVRSEPRVSSLPSYAPNSNSNSNQETDISGTKTQEPVVGPVVGVYGGYAGTQGQMNNGYAQPAFNGYSYSTHGNSAGTPPMFGLSSTGDISMTANFGPVIWGFVAGLVFVILVIWIINIFGGFQYLGGAFEGLRSENEKGTSTGKAKSLDLDQISSLVYSAMDKYNKWNSKSQETYH